MSQEKRNRIAAAITVNVILLIAILTAVVIYQMITLSVIAGRRNQMIAEIKYYQQQTESNENTLDYLYSDEHLRDLALQYGYLPG